MTRLITVSRVLAFLAAILLAWASFSFSAWPFGPAVSIALASLVLICLWFCIRGAHHTDRTVLLWSLLSGATIGAAGLIVGVVASMFIWPSSNLAPILGFFVTGPYSFVAGLGLGILLRFIALYRGGHLGPSEQTI